MARRDAFRDARRAAGHTQERLAELMHVDVSTVKGWERGAEPAAFRLPLLAKLLRMSAADLQRIFTDEEPTGRPRDSAAVPGQPTTGSATETPTDWGAPCRAGDIGLRYERSVRATVDVVAKLGRFD